MTLLSLRGLPSELYCILSTAEQRESGDPAARGHSRCALENIVHPTIQAESSHHMIHAFLG